MIAPGELWAVRPRTTRRRPGSSAWYFYLRWLFDLVSDQLERTGHSDAIAAPVIADVRQVAVASAECARVVPIAPLVTDLPNLFWATLFMQQAGGRLFLATTDSQRATIQATCSNMTLFQIQLLFC